MVTSSWWLLIGGSGALAAVAGTLHYMMTTLVGRRDSSALAYEAYRAFMAEADAHNHKEDDMGRVPRAKASAEMERGKRPPPPPLARNAPPYGWATVEPAVVRTDVRLPGERRRQVIYVIVSIAVAIATAMAIIVPGAWWFGVLSALSGLATVVAAAVVREREREEQAEPELTSNLHPETCDTPGCDCRPPVMDYCAGCDRPDVDTRHMDWNDAGLWRCLGCRGAEPAPAVARLIEAVNVYITSDGTMPEDWPPHHRDWGTSRGMTG